MLITACTKLGRVWRRPLSALFAFALAVTGLVGVTAAPARAAVAMNLAYLMNSDSVSVLDVPTNTVVGTIPLKAGLTQILASPDKRTAYVVDDDYYAPDNAVFVIDAASGRVTHTITVCDNADYAAVKPDGTQLWVGCRSGAVTVIDTVTATVVTTLPPGGSFDGVDLAFSPDGSTVYMTHSHSWPYGNDGLDAINSSTYAVTHLTTAQTYGPGMVLSPDGSTLYITHPGTGRVDLIDTATGATTGTINGMSSSGGGTLNPAGTAIYYCVSMVATSVLTVVDLATKTITSQTGLPCNVDYPDEIAFTPDGNTLYALRGLRHSGISVIDVASKTISATIGNNTAFHMAFVRAAVAPAVTAVSPAQGPEAGKNKVVITGGPFVGGPGASAVSFGGVPALSFTVDSDAQITAVAPAQTFRTVDITVTSDNGTSAIGTADEYTYLEAPPTISSVWPSSGPSTGGTLVYISGTDLSTTKAVTFGGTAAASFTITSKTEITAITSAQTNGTVNVSITNSTGVSTATPSSQYTFYSPVPAVTSVSPATGPLGGGAAVTISGRQFTGAFRVTFGGVPVPYTLNSDAQITVVTPAWSSDMAPAVGTSGSSTPGGTVDIRVTTDVDTSVTSTADRYTFVAPANAKRQT